MLGNFEKKAFGGNNYEFYHNKFQLFCKLISKKGLERYSLSTNLTHLFTMHPFSTPLKTSENRKVFGCFQGVEKGYIGKKWVNASFPTI